jgi:predicted GNAT family acetyltransferase
MSEPKPMPVDRAPLHIRDVPERSRYEATLGDDPTLAGSLEYGHTEAVITLYHTEVQEGFEGQGIGSGLVRGVFDDARARGLRVDPKCPFVVRWLERHKDQADILVESSEAPAPSEPEPA